MTLETFFTFVAGLVSGVLVVVVCAELWSRREDRAMERSLSDD